MQVKNVYKDNEGNWHIDYDTTHLMGLAIRVYFGQIFIGLAILLPLLVLSALVGFTFAKSLPEENNSSFSEPQLESVYHKRDRK